MSRGTRRASNIGGVGLHKGIDLTSDVSLDAAEGLEFGRAAGDLALSKRLRALVGAEPANRDHVEGSVGLTVAATGEAVAISLAGGGGQRATPQSIAQAASDRMRPALVHNSIEG